jgi:hypothetical protein
MIFWFDRGVTI